MYMTACTVNLLLVHLTYANVLTWTNSAVKSDPKNHNKQVIERSSFYPVPIPVEYFKYPDHKPQYAVDVATFHGVRSPEKHYKAYPIRPHTESKPPKLGQYRLVTGNRPIFNQFQKFTKTHEGLRSHVTPNTNHYEVFHPYKAEEPALVNIYKDPVLDKIRNDLKVIPDAEKEYQKQIENIDDIDEDNLDSPLETDKKIVPHPNIPATYENHVPLRKPAYYTYPIYQQTRLQQLNHRFKHPLNQDYVKIKPIHYKPLMGHLQQLRHQQAVKYDDENNQYPQAKPYYDITEPSDGHDIFEKQKQNYKNLRNNIDEKVNKVALSNRPIRYENIELQNYRGNDELDDDETTEFVPLKSYAQVRKTETTKHLPKTAAYEEAEDPEETRNAPRLREAVKSSKAQTVYSEEGYEDSAYDHAGEQKHASDHENHGGFLKEHELSGGKYKTPSIQTSHEDGHGVELGSQKIHGEKHDNEDEELETKNDSEDYTDNENENEEQTNSKVVENKPSKRGNSEKITDKVDSEDYTILEPADPETPEDNDYETTNIKEVIFDDHDVNKRAVEFKVPDIIINDTFLKDEEIIKPIKQETEVITKNKTDEKYPYYSLESEKISKDSPLRYAENVKFIPKKSLGGSEFYDSRALVCADVDEEIDPVPDDVKNMSSQTSDEDDDENDKKTNRRKRDSDIESTTEKKRLKGLGDKIDCFKAKFFGSNPLDSPFFKESLISNPEPLKLPTLPIHKFKDDLKLGSSSHILNVTNRLKQENTQGLSSLFDQLKQSESQLQSSLISQRNQLKDSLAFLKNSTYPKLNNTLLAQQSNVYTDILDNIRKNTQTPSSTINITSRLLSSGLDDIFLSKHPKYTSFLNKEEITTQPSLRKKRNVQLDYEPYKIIKKYNNFDTNKRNQNVNDTVASKPKPYKTIIRSKSENVSEPQSDQLEFVDVSVDIRRGEPRYELKNFNHKTQYVPVFNKKAISLKEYKERAKESDKMDVKLAAVRSLKEDYDKLSSEENFSDVLQNTPKKTDTQNVAASRTIHRIIRTTTPTTKKEIQSKENAKPNEESNEEYDEFDGEEEIKAPTTAKPRTRRRKITTTTTTTTEQPEYQKQTDSKPHKLRLVTRFNKPVVLPNGQKVITETHEMEIPKYKEKSNKIIKSTVITDSKSYGEDDDDMKKDEIDAMMHIKQDMNEYKPEYEKDFDKTTEQQPSSSSSKEKEGTASSSPENEEERSNSDSNNEESGSNESFEEESIESADEEEEEEIPNTTTEAALRKSLPITTEASVITTESRNIDTIPLFVLKKHHRDYSVYRSPAQKTQQSQNIEVKSTVQNKHLLQKPNNKNVEVLNLYKDDHLAQNVNKLGDVEVFKENLNANKSSRHGGNYRSAKIIELTEEKPKPQLHGGNLRARTDAVKLENENSQVSDQYKRKPSGRRVSRIRKIEQVTEKPTKGDAEEIPVETIQDENSPSHIRPLRRKFNKNTVKMIEFGDERNNHDKNNGQPKRGGHLNLSRTLHGGNYKNERLMQSAKVSSTTKKSLLEAAMAKGDPKDARASSAQLLSSFVKAVPILTTTPAYILDPSKRMYFYVEA